MSRAAADDEEEEEEEEEETGVVIDNGTAMLRAGYCGEDEPKVEIPNLTATPKSEVQMWAFGLKEQYIGEEAQRLRGRLALRYPMKGGVVTDWEAMEEVWEATFQELEADPSALSVLMSDRPLTPRAHRERMTETMMETFQVPRLYVMNQAVLAAFGSGRGIAVVLDCGEGATTVMPIEGLSIRPHAILKGDISGADLTNSLRTSMMQRYYDVRGQEGLEAVREVKESLCFVAQDYDTELNAAQETSALEKRYELPDGQLITLNEDRIRVPEALFKPYLLGKCGYGVHELVYKSIMKCDIDSRCHMYVNIIPVGGSTCFPGFFERLQKEISALVPPTMKVKVVNFNLPKTMTFIGGSIVGSLSTFQTCWITKEDYDEHGPIIVHKKCT